MTPLAKMRRRRRQSGDPLDAPLTPVAPPATEQEVVAFQENIQTQENQLQSILSQIMNSPYMPSREQAIQLITTVLTLVLMSLLGPALGSNYNMVSAIVKQILPFIVTAGVHYAADQALAPEAKPSLDAPITDVQLQPVPANQAAGGL